MTTTRLGWILACILSPMVLVLGAMSAAAAPTGAGDPAKGEYLMAANGGCRCHGPDHAGFKPDAAPDQSGAIFQGLFGTVTAKNLTSDRDTGEGSWTDQQKITAIRTGVDIEGGLLFPIMPYNSFHFMSDADVADLVAYLDTLPAVKNQVPENQLHGPMPPPPPLPPSPLAAPTSGVDRGRYLATAVGICGDCHTPVLPDGSPDAARLLAGGVVQTGPTTFDVAPNLTPDKVTGIGDWTDTQVNSVLKLGLEPEGSRVSGLMLAQLTGTQGPGGYSQLTDADAQAITMFLRGIPPVSNVAATGAGFVLGFKTISDLLPDIIGLPLENEHDIANGDNVQTTTGGLLVWSKADNTVAFTDGFTTWVLGPAGVQQRLNTR